MEELAEIIAFDFDDAEGLPKLNSSWRWGDKEQALLSSCSSLIAIVGAEGSRVVQFSHFSVREFLTSPRLGSSNGDISYYHVDLEPAHTILAQACLSMLLQLDDRVEKDGVQQSLPLVQYAAEHWASHAQFKDVSTRIHKGMEYLFDPDKPHFSVWLQLHDIDTDAQWETEFFEFTIRDKSIAGPLYYASLCGFHDLARHLISQYPEYVNARGGHFVTPLVAALSRKHFHTAELLHRNGADPNVRGFKQRTPLHSVVVAYHGGHQMVEELIKYNADVNARNIWSETPLMNAAWKPTPDCHDVVQFLLDHGANVNSRSDYTTALHGAVIEGSLDVVRSLLEHGADVGAKNNEGETPLQIGSKKNSDEIMELLRGHSAM